MIIDCDPVFTRLDGPNEGKQYDANGDEVKEESTKESVVESGTVNTKAVWPFPNSEE